MPAHRSGSRDGWDELFPAERERVVRLLVKEAVLSPDGLTIRIRTNGLRSVVTELRDGAGGSSSDNGGSTSDELIATDRRFDSACTCVGSPGVRGLRFARLAATVNASGEVCEGMDYVLAKMKVSRLFALAFCRDAARDSA